MRNLELLRSFPVLELAGTEEPFCLTVDCDCGVIYTATAVGIIGFLPSSHQVSCINVCLQWKYVCLWKLSQANYFMIIHRTMERDLSWNVHVNTPQPPPPRPPPSPPSQGRLSYMNRKGMFPVSLCGVNYGFYLPVCHPCHSIGCSLSNLAGKGWY